jgi:hypothetical protein
MEDLMPARKIKKIVALAVIGMAMLACTLSGAGQTSEPTPSGATSVALTLDAQMTELASIPTNTSPPTPTWTATVIPPTNTPIPTNTPQPTATRTPAPSPTPIPCNLVGFIRDVTVPDGSLFTPGSTFSKVWRIKNIGSCPWTKNYELVYYSGDKMQGASVTTFNTRVEPGEWIDVGVTLTAPATSGKYLGYWLLRTVDGKLFGMGSDADEPFWVEIRVINPSISAVYHFAANFCEAGWKDSSSPLPCQGAPGVEEEMVQLSNTISMESGVTEDELGLHIYLGKLGVVKGTYPAMVVSAGDHFVAAIGCIKGNQGCEVRFSLSYIEVGTTTEVELGSWLEEYDNDITVINKDLSSLAGKNVMFILKVKSLTNASKTEVFWFVPRIQNP